ncbi:MAG: MATE family efflux transporter [Tissierellia bacterium]|nr:MATE family efflux transporter [Tissierellia bacterium]
MTKTREIIHGDLKKIFFNYLIPSIGGMLGTSLYVLGDTMIVGRGLGPSGLAALNLSIPLINVFNGFGLLFGIGGSTAFSVDRGKGQTENLNRIFTKSMLFSFIVGVILTLIRVFFLDELCHFLGAKGEIFDMSRDYLGMLMSFSIFFLCNTTLMIFVRNDGSPKIAMASMLTGSVINVILDYVFIIQWDWGMKGGALATGLSPIIGLFILSRHFLSKKHSIHLERLQGSFGQIKRLLTNGIPSFIVECSAGLVIFAFNQRLLGLAGEKAVASYSIIANLSLIATAIFTGVGQGIQPIVSVNYGADNRQRFTRTVRMGILTSLLLGIVFYSIGLFFPQVLIAIFLRGNSEIVDLTTTGIRIYFLSFLFMGINIVLTSYIQSKEEAKASFIISLLRGLILVLLFLFLLPKFMGINGVWWTLPLTEVFTLLLSIFLFSKIRRVWISFER